MNYYIFIFIVTINFLILWITNNYLLLWLIRSNFYIYLFSIFYFFSSTPPVKNTFSTHLNHQFEGHSAHVKTLDIALIVWNLCKIFSSFSVNFFMFTNVRFFALQRNTFTLYALLKESQFQLSDYKNGKLRFLSIIIL